MLRRLRPLGNFAQEWSQARAILPVSLEGAWATVPHKAELAKLSSILSHELLVALLEISPASLQRYQSGEREAPDAIAEKAHFLTSVFAAP